MMDFLNYQMFQHTAARRRLGQATLLSAAACCFNTQPPEGGWASDGLYFASTIRFQHTAARRRLGAGQSDRLGIVMFQHTAARRRLARAAIARQAVMRVSTHSRPKAAGEGYKKQFFEHTWFQHTAARRRLGNRLTFDFRTFEVSTHSRPKAAGSIIWLSPMISFGFNTQPPEGGWRL